jgi:hypothetical protein
MINDAIKGKTFKLQSHWLAITPRLAFAPAFIVLLIGLCSDATLPGVYMDGVNPDYIAVALINHHAKPFPIWLLDGNYVFNRFPIMINIYYGALPYWIGLPVFSLFGTGIIGIRIAHAILAVCVIGAVLYFLRATRTSGLIIAITALALASDPSFQYMFRNQFYITVFPVSLILVSMALIMEGGSQLKMRAVLSGVASGLAAYGYFIFYFFALAVALAAPALRKSQLLWRWLTGIGFGLSPVALGYLLFIGSHGGPTSALHAALNLTNRLGVTQSQMDIWSRLQFAFDLYGLTLSDQANTWMMLKTAVPFLGIEFKNVILVAIPALIFIALELSRRPNQALRLCVAMLLMPLLYTLIFGDRLWAQHFTPALPLFYCFAALAYDHIRRIAIEGVPAFLPMFIHAAAGCAILLVIPFNAWNMMVVNSELHATGGVGLMSDAINRFSESARDDSRSSIYIFPDWGLHMEFAMLTGGTSEIRVDFDPVAVRQALSSGHDVVVATIGDRARNRRDRFAEAVSMPAPVLSEVRQRDGVPIIFIARWQQQ